MQDDSDRALLIKKDTPISWLVILRHKNGTLYEANSDSGEIGNTIDIVVGSWTSGRILRKILRFWG